MKKTCETCAYFHEKAKWEFSSVVDGYQPSMFLVCRRYPEEISVNLTYWCGEWSRKEEDRSDDE